MLTKSRHLRFIAAASVSLLLLAAGWAGAQPGLSMSDPVFGIRYQTGSIHFENAPRKLGQLCRDLGSENFWVYAYWKERDTEYFVLSSRKSEVSGAGAVIHRDKCIVGLPDWLLTGEARYGGPDKIDNSMKPNDAVVHGLALDLLHRYTVAFGSKQKFLEAARRHPPSHLMPILSSEFKEYAQQP
jgi:hypothetical protein